MIYWLLKKSKIKNGLALVLTIISTISFFVVTFFSFVLLLWDEGTSHENNPWRYNHIKDIADYTSYTYQFPKELSEELLNDREVRFYYTPQFLQGAFQLNLLIELNANEMNKYIKQYENREKVIIDMKKALKMIYNNTLYMDHMEFLKKMNTKISLKMLRFIYLKANRINQITGTME